MIEGAVYQDGLVAVRFHQPIPKLVQIGEEKYFFDARHGVSLAFIPETAVPSALEVMGGCCGGRKKVITLASEAVYQHFLNGNGGR